MTANRDPRHIGPKPPFPEQQQSQPGTVKQLNPPADHGEQSYVGNGKLKGRVAIVTGADSGIGRAIAIAFAKEGADIVLSYLPEEEADAAEVAGLISKLGQRPIQLPGDIGDPLYARSLVDAALKEFKQLDIVVSNAAYQMTHEQIEDISDEEFEHTYRTNVFGMFYLCKAALKHLKPGGVILATSSIQAYEPSEGLLAYASTKAAIANFAKGLSKLAAKNGVRVNAVAPGPVWTPLIPSTMPADKVKQFGATSLFERPAQPIELARLFVFLASDDASYATGEFFGTTGVRTPL
jgi:NAD(P)-dependent dehydrogenase (short-subunit alcohol dehydrogenase family)